MISFSNFLLQFDKFETMTQLLVTTVWTLGDREAEENCTSCHGLPTDNTINRSKKHLWVFKIDKYMP